MAINSRAKGARGEREFCDWLEKTFDLKEKPKRNLEQVREGGWDVNVKNVYFEVKRCEKLHLRAWWLQISNATPRNGTSVVAFRQNKHNWQFLITARLIGCKGGYLLIEEPQFIQFIQPLL